MTRLGGLLLALSCAHPLPAQTSADTVHWEKTVIRGDTTWKLAGDSITTLVRIVRVDTTMNDRTVKPPLAKGITFAAYASPDVVAEAPFTGTMRPYNSSVIVQNIARARTAKTQLVMAMTGGAHENSMKNGRWDYATWKARMDRYNTPAIRAAIAAGVADGTIVGNSVMDEPQNQTKGKAWGPPGYMTKARVDSMCRYVKSLFPTMPTGVVHDAGQFQPTVRYAACDFILSQYRAQKAPVKDFVAEGLAYAKFSGIAIIFSLNVMHGGKQVPGCTQYNEEPNDKLCPTTAKELLDYGLPLGTAGCAFTLWEYEEHYWDVPGVVASFKAIGDSLRKAPAKSCRRTA